MSNEAVLALFDSAIQNEVTRKQYHYFLDKFMVWRGITEFSDLLKEDPLAITNSIIQYVAILKDQKRPRSSIQLAVYPIFLFLSMNDVIINEKKIKKSFPKTESEGGSDAYTTDQLRKIIDALGNGRDSLTLRNRAIFYFLASTGCRLGAVPSLKISDLQKVGNLYGVTIYKKTVEEYSTFLTKEASQHLERYLQNPGRNRMIDFDDIADYVESKTNPITKDSSLFDISYYALKSMMYRAVVKAEVRGQRDPHTGRYKTSMAHSIRKRASTIMKNVENANDSKVEKILGHKKYLDRSYNKANIEDLKTEFDKSAHLLEIGKGSLSPSIEI